MKLKDILQEVKQKKVTVTSTSRDFKSIEIDAMKKAGFGDWKGIGHSSDKEGNIYKFNDGKKVKVKLIKCVATYEVKEI